MSSAQALDVLLDTLTLDEAGEVKAAIARALASKLDEARDAESGAVAMAISAIATTLNVMVNEIVEGTAERDEFVAGLFGKVGNP